MSPLKNIKIKTIGRLFVLALVLGGGALVSSSVIVSRNAASIQNNWYIFKESQSEKARALNALRREIGYGGMIHQFKNHILRKNKSLRAVTGERLGGALAAIARYRALGVSPAEKSALADIKAMLKNYAQALDRVHRLIGKGKTAVEMDKAAKVDDGPALKALETLENEISASTGGKSRKPNKTGLLSALYKDMGYGGAIHYFKNFILRHDQALIGKVNKNLQAGLKTITVYSGLVINQAEKKALADIRAVIGVYGRMISTVDRLAKEGKTPEVIDRSVIVDDGPALAGFTTLAREIAAEIQVKAVSVERSLEVVRNMADTQSLVDITLVALLIAASFWLIQFRIVAPVTSLTGVMTSLAAGDLEVKIPATDNKSEIGEMAHAVEEFKINAIARRRAELNLRDSEEKSRSVLESVIDGIITINTRGGIETFNPAAEEIFGYRAGEVVGNNVKMLMPEPYHGEHDGYLKNFMDTGDAKVIGIGREVTGLRKNGGRFPMELAVGEMKVAGKRMFTGIVRDITERKKAEKMKSEFVSTVSHELRTPLTSVMGSLSLVRGGAAGEVPEKALAMVDIAYKNSDRLVRLINDILDSEKLASGNMNFRMETLDVMELVERSIEENKGYGEEHNVTFTVRDRLAGAKINGDADRLLQVLANLMSNAAKFSPDGEKVELSVSRKDDRIRIAVTDRGPGIPDEFRNSIFGRFSQSDSSDTRQKGGTGLGLSISKAIVEKHDGAIGFETEIGIGTTFSFDLPDRTIRLVAAGAAKKKKSAGHILICDDEPDAARLIQMILERGGFSSDIASGAEKARKLLAEKTYDAMTLDIMPRGQNGLSIFRELRKNPATKNLPVIVISAKGSEGRQKFNGNAGGVIDWLEKPIDEGRLMA
ncbi:MAG TPA: hybrid sensor histidine kinase/response regulator, partial [Alphaproteobacteria bacterium]|nr:hybrid sensor histidine kinase/response regulator [Alphaproteobacteria bacterium]